LGETGISGLNEFQVPGCARPTWHLVFQSQYLSSHFGIYLIQTSLLLILDTRDRGSFSTDADLTGSNNVLKFCITFFNW